MPLPVFVAGRKLRASELAAIVDTMNVASVRAADSTSRTTTSTSYTQVLSPAGLCGVAFVAPPSGKVQVHWSCSQNNGTSPNIAQSSPAIRAGSTVGAGTSFRAAGGSETETNIANTRAGVMTIVSGLTPGTTYNVCLEHRAVATGTATFADREVSVLPLLG